jgi:hypothetical protein
MNKFIFVMETRCVAFQVGTELIYYLDELRLQRVNITHPSHPFRCSPPGREVFVLCTQMLSSFPSSKLLLHKIVAHKCWVVSPVPSCYCIRLYWSVILTVFTHHLKLSLHVFVFGLIRHVSGPQVHLQVVIYLYVLLHSWWSLDNVCL